MIILSDSSFDHLQGEIGPRQTNIGDQEVLQNLQNLIDRVTQEFDQTIPLKPIIEFGSRALMS